MFRHRDCRRHLADLQHPASKDAGRHHLWCCTSEWHGGQEIQIENCWNHCHAQGYLLTPVKVTLPPPAPPRDRWLTRDEAAKLLRAAWRNPKSKHLARFILTAIHTGTRSGAILNLMFMARTQGGYVDTESGMMYRRGAGQAATKKRQPPIPIPGPLLAHMRRWEKNGARWVVEVDGQRVASVKTAWARALKEAGIDHCTRHDLRHTSITWAMQRGMDRWIASGFSEFQWKSWNGPMPITALTTCAMRPRSWGADSEFVSGTCTGYDSI